MAGRPLSVPATLREKSGAPPPPVTTFRVKLEGKGSGELIVGNGMLKFYADQDGGDSFEFPLSEVTCEPYYYKRPFGRPTLVGFYLQHQGVKGGRSFRSPPDILPALQGLGCRAPAPH